MLVPQKRLALPYFAEIRSARRRAGAEVTIATLGSLSHQIVSLFWPLIAEQLSQDDPFRHPKFLSSELIQYLMFKLLDPEIERNDYFNSVTISRARLFSQLADNLNKSALVGFPHTSIAERLKTALPGDAERQRIFEDAQVCANLFREYCEKHRLLDFSLQIVLFANFLWKHEIPRAYLTQRYKYVIADNTEENAAVINEALRDWLPECQSAMVMFDEEASYRRFLGADESSAESLAEVCTVQHRLETTRVMSPAVQTLLAELREIMTDEPVPKPKGDLRAAFDFTPASHSRFHTQMVDWVADSVARLIQEEGVQPNQIVVLAPLLGDSLRFSLVSRLEEKGIPSYTLRPSRPLHAEPAVRALITLAKLAHPDWQIAPEHQVKKFDVIQMLLSVIAEMDLARATLLSEVRFVGGKLMPFNEITKNPEMRQRISEVFGERFDKLVAWLEAYKSSQSDAPKPVDLFFSKLFGEVLSQKGYGFHPPAKRAKKESFDEARIISNLIDSSRAFRQTLSQIEPEADSGQEYARMVDAGILADQYEPREWKKSPNAVLIAPAYTFLLSNQPADYQFWLNIDSPAWTRRLQQPLTQPYVLSRQWPAGQIWTEIHEQKTSRETLLRVVTGLLKRCRKKVFIGYSKFDERGNEREGELRMYFDLLLRELNSKPNP